MPNPDVKSNIFFPDSDRLQVLTPFAPFDEATYQGCRLLIKAKGKCTTDHISMAGPWLKYRGHLDNISNNLLIGAVNYFNDQTNSVCNQLTGVYEAVPTVARSYKKEGISTIVVGGAIVKGAQTALEKKCPFVNCEKRKWRKCFLFTYRSYSVEG